MFINYLKITLRNLLNSKLYSTINLAGLSIGLASSLLIGLFVLDELSYDRFFKDSDRIYRVSRDFPKQGFSGAANAPQVAPLLRADFPEIESVTRLFGGQALLKHDDTAFYEKAIRFVDRDFFKVFAFDWQLGDPATALSRPYTMVLTQSIAHKYFGNESPLGKTMVLENAATLEVTGVIADLPHNSHLLLDVLISESSLIPMVGEKFFENWSSNNFHTYIKLKPGISISAISSQFTAFLDRHLQPNSASFTGMTATPLSDIHLYSNRQNEMATPGSITNVYVFSAAALFILLIACFNFMNLATARSSRRAREVGVRKAMGASRGQVARQFFAESLILTALAALLGLALVEVVLPAFNGLLDKSLSLGLLLNLRMPLLLVVVVVIVGLFAGSYPALYLSGFNPVQVLRSVLIKGGSIWFRNTLVVLQFGIAIVLVVATVVALMQLRFARNIELGFQKDQIVVLTGSPTAGLGTQWEAMREELLRNPDILAVTASSQTPLEANTNSIAVTLTGDDNTRAVPFMRVDYDFFTTYNIPVLAGRGFSKDFPADRVLEPRKDQVPVDAGYVLNRLAVENFGWTPESAIGKPFNAYNNGPHPGRIVGVVDNSYFESVHAALKPMVFIMPEPLVNKTATMSQGSLRLSGRNLEATLAYVDATWKRFNPSFPLERHFLDDRFAALHLTETRQSSVFNAFAMLAIFIASMGLYGLASFNAERRRKEIGVRKVMGGSVWSIVLLLTNDFSKLVLIANIIAWPVAYYTMHQWLQNFAYRIDLTPLVFIGSGLIALSIAWVTVGGTAAKAASQKPVLALRYE